MVLCGLFGIDEIPSRMTGSRLFKVTLKLDTTSIKSIKYDFHTTPGKFTDHVSSILLYE